MSILDRHILIRFLVNFALLFTLLFVFAVAVDLILQLDKFVEVVRSRIGSEAGAGAFSYELALAIVDFQGPRVFQFYAYLHGLVAIGAMGFTLAQMHRYRELVAIMASGVSLRRVAMPFFVAAFGLSVVQLLNQELILPRVAPLLLRDHKEIGSRGVDSFEVMFTRDTRGTLLQAPLFDPLSETLSYPTFLERDQLGRTVRRITATSATWSERDKGWILTEPAVIRQRLPNEVLADAEDHHAGAPDDQPPEIYHTDISPKLLMVRRYNQFASMLSLSQISEMLAVPETTGRDALLRHRYSRFASALSNLLVLGLTLPCFLLREPAKLIRQSLLAASLAVPATIGSAIGMMVDMPGLPPAVGVFLPVIVLALMAMFPWTVLKT